MLKSCRTAVAGHSEDGSHHACLREEHLIKYKNILDPSTLELSASRVASTRLVGWSEFKPFDESLFWNLKGLDSHPSSYVFSSPFLCGSRRGSFITYANRGAHGIRYSTISLLVSVDAK
jgi:hypothetical protein